MEDVPKIIIENTVEYSSKNLIFKFLREKKASYCFTETFFRNFNRINNTVSNPSSPVRRKRASFLKKQSKIMTVEKKPAGEGNKKRERLIIKRM